MYVKETTPFTTLIRHMSALPLSKYCHAPDGERIAARIIIIAAVNALMSLFVVHARVAEVTFGLINDSMLYIQATCAEA